MFLLSLLLLLLLLSLLNIPIMIIIFKSSAHKTKIVKTHGECDVFQSKTKKSKQNEIKQNKKEKPTNQQQKTVILFIIIYLLYAYMQFLPFISVHIIYIYGWIYDSFLLVYSGKGCSHWSQIFFNSPLFKS